MLKPLPRLFLIKFVDLFNHACGLCNSRGLKNVPLFCRHNDTIPRKEGGIPSEELLNRVGLIQLVLETCSCLYVTYYSIFIQKLEMLRSTSI